MQLPTLAESIERLSLSDRTTVATLHACHEAQLVQVWHDASHWHTMYTRMPTHVRAVLDRVRRAGGTSPATWLMGLAGPLRSNLTALSPRTLLTIYHDHTPLEALFVLGMIWPLDTPNGSMWVILPEIEACLPDPHAVLVASAPLHGDADVDAHPVLDEMLCQMACLAVDRRVPLQHHGRVSQVVAQRITMPALPIPYIQWLVATLLAGGACIAEQNHVVPTHTMVSWFAMPVHARHQEVVRAWLQAAWNEWELGPKRRPPALDVRAARRAMLHEFLPQLPDEWCATADVRQQIKQGWPDIFRGARNALLMGWQTRWDDDDGQLLTYLLCGPLCWLGVVESAQGGLLVRRTAFGRWMAGLAPAPPEHAPQPALLEADYTVVVPDTRNILARFQLHRIATWRDAVTAQLSPQRVAHVLANGMSMTEYCAILQQAIAPANHPDMLETIRRWGGTVMHVQMTPMVVLHADDQAVIHDIRHDRRVQLPDTTWVRDTHLAIPPADAPAVARRLRAAGYVVDAAQLRPAQFSDDELMLIEKALQQCDDTSEAMRVLRTRITQVRGMRGTKRHG